MPIDILKFFREDLQLLKAGYSGCVTLRIWTYTQGDNAILVTSTSDDHDFEVGMVTGYKTLALTREDFARAEVIPAKRVDVMLMN